MTLTRSILLACLALAGCDKKKGTDMPPTPTPVRKVDLPADDVVAPLATANNAFAFDVWNKAAPAGNAAISPASITTALAMTWGGAKGATAEQMRTVLHLDAGDPAKVSAMWGDLSSALQNPKRTLTLRIANRLFGEKDFTFVKAFIDTTRDAYGAPLEPTDFKGAPEPARAHINEWIEAQTEHRIKDLLPPRSITADTRLVLTNAIYFLADWASPFEKNTTFDAPFRLSATENVNVPTMHQEGGFRTVSADGVSVLELPYTGNDAVMLIILPDAVDGLPAVEKMLDATTFSRWRRSLTDGQVLVSLPKFTIDPPEALELSTPLKTLGMAAAFDPETADFTGIGVPPDPSKKLYISAVFHKAFVKVDEKGTEAAAATAVVMPEGTGAHAPSPQFTADHPFLFAIVDKTTGLILFLGRVAKPTL